MYKNLKAEMARVGITQKRLAEMIGCSYTALSMKLNGKSPLKLSEAAMIKSSIGVDIPLEVLFESDQPCA